MDEEKKDNLKKQDIGEADVSDEMTDREWKRKMCCANPK
jgi:hypothetical protein